jgi:predicted nucleic acid-binding protein
MAIAKTIRVFVDSDVIISSLISKSGAAYALLHNTSQIKLHISNFSILELERVVNRLDIELETLNTVIATRLNSVKVNLPYERVQHEFADYVRDPHDAHIVAGAKEAKAAFLVSYNIRHFVPEKLRQDFQIILLTPSLFLQYLRSL